MLRRHGVEVYTQSVWRSVFFSFRLSVLIYDGLWLGFNELMKVSYLNSYFCADIKQF